MTVWDIAENKLMALGLTEINVELLNMSVAEAEAHIKNICNISRLPKELYYDCASCACGKYLVTLNAFGKLGDAVDFEAAVSQISEGDVSVSFADGASAEERFLTLVSGWADPDPAALLRFRRLTW